MSTYKIRHLTRYTYNNPVRDSANQILLYPIKDPFQEVINHSITVSGSPAIETHTDFYGNTVGTFMHVKPHTELVIDSQLTVISRPRQMPEDQMSAAAQWNELKSLEYRIPFLDFLRPEPFRALSEVQRLVSGRNHETETPLELTRYFSEYIFKHFSYQKGITTIETTLDEIWMMRSGVCQDFAHMLLAVLRQMKIPARYVSGYICPHHNGMRGEGATHAWVEAYIPSYGWLGVDPTNNCLVNDKHVRLATGKNFSDCSPVKGTFRGVADSELKVAVSVEYEDGVIEKGVPEIVQTEPSFAYTENFYRKHQEMQAQQ